MKAKGVHFILLIFLIFTMTDCALASIGGFRYYISSSGEELGRQETVVGFMQVHTVSRDETLLDIARDYGLGFNEIQILYPSIDPWIPDPGLCLSIPTRWVLPPTRYQGIVINLPELRLYRFFPRIGMVKSYPVGIGEEGWETPEGIYRVVDREVNPTWVVPPSLQEKYGKIKIPPGPDNPLGKYWLGLSRNGYGIHGTNFAWSVGRLVSLGCIRLYPEHMVRLFEEVPVSTPVEIIYEPIKIGFTGGEIFIEVHPDLYRKIPNLDEYARGRFHKLGLSSSISWDAVRRALRKRDGVPIPIGILRKGGDADKAERYRSFVQHDQYNLTAKEVYE